MYLKTPVHKQLTNLADKPFLPAKSFWTSVRKHQADLLLLCLLVFTGGCLSYQGAECLTPRIVTQELHDSWFDSDAPRVYENLTARKSDQRRTNAHPLFPLLNYSPVAILRKVFQVPSLEAVRLVLAMEAGLWLGSLFGLLRLIGCQRLDALMFSVLGTVSAGAMFWFVIPETYPLSSLSFLPALALVALTPKRIVSPIWYVLASALTLSVTITNWMVGILVALVSQSRLQALKITKDAFALVVLLWSLQHYIFPSSLFFLGDREDQTYIVGSFNLIDAVERWRTLFFSTMVMPGIQVIQFNDKLWPSMSIQYAQLGSGGIWGTLAALLWLTLLLLGLWNLVHLKEHPQLRLVIGLTLIGQMFLHLLYGWETFLYSLHFLPFLILLAALSTLTPARPWVLLLTAGLIVTAGVNNLTQFKHALAFYQTYDPALSKRHPTLTPAPLLP